MLRPEKMLRVFIGVPEEYLDSALRSIGSLGVLHVTPFSESAKEFRGLAKPVEVREESYSVSALFSRVETLLSSLSLPTLAPSEVSVNFKEEKNLAVVVDYLGGIESRVAGIRERITKGESSEELEVRTDAEKAQKELEELGKEVRDKLSQLRATLLDLKRIEDVRASTGKSGTICILEGWIPANRHSALTSTLQKSCEGKYLLEAREPRGHGEKPPTLTRLPKVFESFESLTSGFGIQTYGEINPAIFMILTFPVLFGLMFGDIGHGALLLIFALIIYRYQRKGGKVPETFQPIIKGSALLIMLGISSIVFGYLYGEFFGGEFWRLLTNGAQAPWFNPFEDMSEGKTTFLTITFIVGIFHIGFGITIDLVNKLMRKEYSHALAGPLPWLWLYGGSAYFFFTNTLVNYPDNSVQFFAQMLETNNFIVYVAVPLAVMMIARIIVEGFMEGFGSTLESFLSSLAHTISYSRILALNIVHAVFSAMPFFFASSTTNPIFIGSFIAFTLLTMTLELLISFLNTLRLHWVEWFMKFYKGDGYRFQPFSLAILLMSP